MLDERMLNTDNRKKLLAACLALAMAAGLMGPVIAQACAAACESTPPEPVKSDTPHCAMQDANAACCTDSEAPTPAKTDTIPAQHAMASCECSLSAPAAIPLARTAEERILSQPVSTFHLLAYTSSVRTKSPHTNVPGSHARHETAQTYLYHCAILR